jgi:hypothetical protein
VRQSPSKHPPPVDRIVATKKIIFIEILDNKRLYIIIIIMEGSMKVNILIIIFLVNFTVGVFSQDIVSDGLIQSINATSTLQHRSDIYNVNNLLKDDLSSWAEGQSDYGSNVSITIKFKTRVRIKEFSIKNGYGDFNYYKANNRIKTMRVRYGRGSSKIYLEDNPGFQRICFNTYIETNELILDLIDVYQGDTYNDSCLTRITFTEWEELPHIKMNDNLYYYFIKDVVNIFGDYLVENYGYNDDFRYDTRHHDDNLMFSLLNSRKSICSVEDGSLIFIYGLSLSEDIWNALPKNDKNGYRELVLFGILKNNQFVIDQSLFPLSAKEFLQEIDIEMTNPAIGDDIEKLILLRKTIASSINCNNSPFENFVYDMGAYGIYFTCGYINLRDDYIFAAKYSKFFPRNNYYQFAPKLKRIFIVILP